MKKHLISLKYDNKKIFDEELSGEPLTEEAVIEAFKKYKNLILNPNKVNRVEVINHNSVDEFHSIGRNYTHYSVKSCELDFQDGGETLKIFI